MAKRKAFKGGNNGYDTDNGIPVRTVGQMASALGRQRNRVEGVGRMIMSIIPKVRTAAAAAVAEPPWSSPSICSRLRG